MSTIIRDDDFRKVVAEFGGVVITDTQSQTSMAASLSPDERRALADALNTAAVPYPQGGQWTREVEGELWAAIRDELRHIYPSSTDWHHRKLDLAASASVDAVREKLNARHPKYQPYDQGGVRGADSLLYRAERADVAAAEWAEDAHHPKPSGDLYSMVLSQAGHVHDLKADLADMQRERDAAVARAEAAERELADEYSEANQKAAVWDRIRAHPALRRNLLPDVEGSYADLVFERITWLAEVAETVTELQSAPAVSRAEIEAAIQFGGDHTPDTCDCTEQEICEGLAAATAAVWSLVSGSDPAVHVVRESELPHTEDDYLRNFDLSDGRGKYRNATDDEIREAREMAEFDLRWLIAVQQHIEAEQTVDPILDKARELYRAATPDARWETVADEYRRIARHVLGQEASSHE
ncbi:hypothetical protein M3B38_01845 [Dietzia cinnamea]|uniref:hypothetical protein n=1 Tax=Dietzia cinnamea TaxID=321318 RepID=UPI0021A85613|nr:hypothetical protein [Dietzia cinnamea]MCT1710730.1 hypothetical protein [Dietzia cinnamea]